MAPLRIRNFRRISTSAQLHQEAQLAELLPPPRTTPPPPNPPSSSGSPLFNENWRNPLPHSSAGDAALIPFGLGFLRQTSTARMQSIAQSLDAQSLMNQFADWATTQRWAELKQLFEFWIRSLDKAGKPNKPDVNIYNHYLRTNLMIGASAGELLDLVSQMDEYGISPNTASFNIVLKAMKQANEVLAAEKLIERMIRKGIDYKGSLPDDESYDIIIGMLLSTNQVDSALKYIDLILKSGFTLSMNAFSDCVQSCARNARLETLISIIERCKEMDQNKSLCPPWIVCNYIADIAIQSDNSELIYYSLEFMARWIARRENARSPVHLSVDEGLIISALETASRSYSQKLLDISWAILKRSLPLNGVPCPQSYLAKMYSHANFGNLQKAFSTLRDFEIAHGKFNQEDEEDLFSPFHSLNPLVAACSKNGFETLDTVYYQLENLSQANPPYKSIAALNCIILGCANIWDLDRAYQTFNAIDTSFGLTPNIHSYNALISAFGKLSEVICNARDYDYQDNDEQYVDVITFASICIKASFDRQRDEAVKVFEHFVGLGVKPNATTYSLLVHAHLIKREPQAALMAIDSMVHAGFEPSKQVLKQLRRRCIREMDYESNDKVESIARQFKIRLGTEVRRDVLFNLQYRTDYA